MVRLPALLFVVMLGHPASAFALGGFDFALERFEVRGAVQHVDDFDDGLRDSGPTARLRDRLGTHVTEGGDVLRLTDRDGAARPRSADARFSDVSRGFADLLGLNQAIARSTGATTIEAEFGPDLPSEPGTSFGVGIVSYDPAGLVADGFWLAVEWVRSVDGTYQVSDVQPCFVRDGAVVKLWRENRGLYACHPIDPDAVTGSIVLQLELLTTPTSPDFTVAARISTDGGTTVLPDTTWPRGYGSWVLQYPRCPWFPCPPPTRVNVPPVVPAAVGRVFPIVFASAWQSDSMFHGAGTPANETRAPTGELVAIRGGLREVGPTGRPMASADAVRPGSFSLTASGSSDLRTAPGAFELTLPDGSIMASAVRRHGLRRVDVTSGRPVEAGAPAHATCVSGSESACLLPGELMSFAQSIGAFSELCRSTVGFSSLDRSVCAQSVFNSQTLVVTTGDTLAHALATVLAPSITLIADAIMGGLAGPGAGTANGIIQLDQGSSDGAGFSPRAGSSISRRLTDQQEALLGCGPLYGQSATGCDDSGIDLLNAEASALLQSFPGIGGTTTVLTNDATAPQPGTVAFFSLGGPVALRIDGSGFATQLPGARSPWLDPFNPFRDLYDPRVDGCVDPSFEASAPAGTCASARLVHPFTGQAFVSELAAFSWNLLQLLVAFSSPDTDGARIPGTTRFAANEPDEFDEVNPLRTDGCSFVKPRGCSAVEGFIDFTTRGLPDDPELPNARRWLWESGGEYRITSANGRLGAYAGGTVYALGPAQSEVPGFASGTTIVLAPGPIDDADGDGVAASSDTCPAIADTGQQDSDGDGVGDACDNCPHRANPTQIDRGGVGASASSDGIGDVCQCGDVTGDGRVTLADAIHIQRSLAAPPTTALAHPERCDVDVASGCDLADAVILRRALLVPPTATIQQLCPAAVP